MSRQANQALKIGKIISGGQTGADRAGLDAAIELQVPHGGWCPRGRLAEDGTIPSHYRLRPTRTADYAERTRQNVLAADATLIFTYGPARGGSAVTIGFAVRHHRPWLHLDLARPVDNQLIVNQIKTWLRATPRQQFLWDQGKRKARGAGNSLHAPTSEPAGLTLNIAGSRASSATAVYPRVQAIISELLSELK